MIKSLAASEKKEKKKHLTFKSTIISINSQLIFNEEQSRKEFYVSFCVVSYNSSQVPI